MARVFSLADGKERERLKGSVCAVGVFDGVHLGHRHVIGKAIEAARAEGRDSVVLTFDIDPDELFSPESLKKLQTNEERIHALASLPVDGIAVLPFDEELAAMEPEEFLEEFFGTSTPTKVYVGSDFRFGAHAAGDLHLMEQWGRSHSMDVCAVDLLEVDGAPVKSTRIRELLDAGDRREANRLMGKA